LHRTVHRKSHHKWGPPPPPPHTHARTHRHTHARLQPLHTDGDALSLPLHCAETQYAVMQADVKAQLRVGSLLLSTVGRRPAALLLHARLPCARARGTHAYTPQTLSFGLACEYMDAAWGAGGERFELERKTGAGHIGSRLDRRSAALHLRRPSWPYCTFVPCRSS
jgi:hypothetical protein